MPIIIIRNLDFQWVEGDNCEVLIQVINPSSYELRISNMQLLTEDVEFESESTSFILPPNVDHKTTPTIVSLSGNDSFFFVLLLSSIIMLNNTFSGIPRRPGLLKIVGYSMTVLGLRNHCKLKSAMPLMGSAFFSIHVVPALPRLSVEIASPNQ